MAERLGKLNPSRSCTQCLILARQESPLPPIEVTLMSQVLSINGDDPRIMYEREWGQNVNCSFTSSSSSPGLPNELFSLFRGMVHT